MAPAPKPSRCGLSWVPSRKECGGGVPVRGPACLCPPAPASDTCPSSPGHMAAPAPRRSPGSRVSVGTSRPRRSEPPTDLRWVESVLLRSGLQLLGSGRTCPPHSPEAGVVESWGQSPLPHSTPAGQGPWPGLSTGSGGGTWFYRCSTAAHNVSASASWSFHSIPSACSGQGAPSTLGQKSLGVPLPSQLPSQRPQTGGAGRPGFQRFLRGPGICICTMLPRCLPRLPRSHTAETWPCPSPQVATQALGSPVEDQGLSASSPPGPSSSVSTGTPGGSPAPLASRGAAPSLQPRFSLRPPLYPPLFPL